MLISRSLFEKLTEVYDARVSELRESVDMRLQVVLAAKEVAHQQVMAARDAQVSRLEAEVEYLRDAVKHERQRAEDAVNRLLSRDANVMPVGIKPEEPKRVVDSRLEQVAKIFSQINGVGEDAGDAANPMEKVETGGAEVAL